MALTAWEFRNKLSAILSAAQHSGQRYVDVDSGQMDDEFGDKPRSTDSMPICHKIMTRLMRPGDSILQDTGEGEHSRMMVRYKLDATHDNERER